MTPVSCGSEETRRIPLKFVTSKRAVLACAALLLLLSEVADIAASNMDCLDTPSFSQGTLALKRGSRLPASMLVHTVHLWTVKGMFQRAEFLAEVILQIRVSWLLLLCRVDRSSVQSLTNSEDLPAICFLYAIWSLRQECNKVDQAEELCRRALLFSESHADDEREHVETLFEFARFQHQFRGNLNAAEDLYQRVLDTDPHHLGALCNYGLLHHTEPNERWDEAVFHADALSVL